MGNDPANSRFLQIHTPDDTRDDWIGRLEDLKVLRRSPDLLNNVKIGQGQLQLIMEQIFVLPYMGVAEISVKWLKQSNE